MRLWNNVFRPVVQDRADLRRYVGSVTLFAWIVAIVADVINQILSAGSWTELALQCLVTAVVVPAIAVPLARSMGRAHLDLHHARAEAERLSRTDPLTGLANRRAFYEAAAQLRDGAVALAVADIDRFKRINDRYGHQVGDEIIKSVASRMRDALGDLGVVARLGGEEFALVTAGRSGDEIRARLQDFRQRVAEEPALVGGQLVFTSVSIGFAARGDSDFDALYAAADKALYVAKSAGRDRVVDFDETAGLATDEARQAG